VGGVVTVVREDGSGRARLVSYVVPAAPDLSLDFAQLREYLVQRLPDYMVPSAFVQLTALPLETTGKVNKAALPAPDFAVTTGREQPSTERERTLCALFAEVLNLPSVGVEDGFFELGGDSIVSIQLVSKAKEAGLVLTARQIFTHKTVRALAAVAGTVDAAPPRDKVSGIGEVPLTPIMAWLRTQGPASQAMYQSVLVRVPAELDEDALLAMLQAVLDRHDALRMHTVGDDGHWTVSILPIGAISAASCLRRVDITGLDDDARTAAIAEGSRAAVARLDPAAAAMVQAVWFDAGPGQLGRLFLAVHHLAVDGVSWRILLADLASAWQSVRAGHGIELAEVVTPFAAWAKELAADAQRPERLAELPAWLAVVDRPAGSWGDRDLDPSVDLVATAGRVRRTVPSELTSALLTSVPAALGASVEDVLLGALALALTSVREARGWPGTANLIEVEGHGRESADPATDLSRTVGWFTTTCPVRLDPGAGAFESVISSPDTLGAVFRRLKEQLRAVSGDRLGYGLLRYLREDTRSRLADLIAPSIGFNYLGRFVSGDASEWSIAGEEGSLGGGGNEDLPMSHVIELTAITDETPEGPRLTATWLWPKDLLSEEDIDMLADNWARVLGALAGHVAARGSAGLTPSDVSLVDLDQSQIDQLETLLRMNQ
jgi:non-ribosomal peptide synthase protein (TIGR01720 family)